MAPHCYVYFGNLALYQQHNGTFTGASSSPECILNYGDIQTAVTLKVLCEIY